MEAFLMALALSLPTPLRGIAVPVADRLVRVWRYSDQFFKRIKGGMGTVVTGALRLRDGLLRTANEVLRTMTWVIVVRIPQAIAKARDEAIAWTVQRITEARNLATALVNTLRTWVTARLADLAGLLNGLQRWLMEQLGGLRETIRQIVTSLLGPLRSPATLAAWAAGAMWQALWRYGYSQVDKIAEAFWRRRQALLLRGLIEIERLLGRLL